MTGNAGADSLLTQIAPFLGKLRIFESIALTLY
jgi:hypothetical protein